MTCHKTRILFSSLFLFSAAATYSQRPVPEAYSTSVKVNYVRTWEPVAPTTDANSLHIATTIDKAHMTTQYSDGLGRPLQAVIKAASPTGQDLVAPVVYDEFGREQFKYLPYVSSQTSGAFVQSPFSEQATFMQGQYGSQDETYYYGQMHFEASPLNRPLKTLAPGNSWVGSNRGVETNYLINTAQDSVRLWTVSDLTGGFGSYVTAATYASGELYKTVTIDEGGHEVVEYKDKEGKVVLKKVQLENNPVGAHTGWLCTYYLYDDLGQLRAVVQPRGVELINSSWTLDANLLKEQCFRYEYDSRGRIVMKQVPGAAPVYMVYDARDRLVMTQDGNLRSDAKKQWLVTQYDNLNRPIATYTITDPTNYTNAAYHWGQAAVSTAYPNVNSYTNELLTETYYDGYTNLPADLAFKTAVITPSAFETNYNTTPLYAQPLTPATLVKGLVTWTRTRVLGTADFITSVSYYDDKGRVIQVQTKNHTGGVDLATTQYDWSGKVLRTHQLQQMGTTTPLTVATRMTYDGGGRLTLVEKNVGNGGWHKLSELSYDALGQLQNKGLGLKPGSTSLPLEELKNEYNIRGWLLGTNKDYVSGNNTTKKFGFELAYDKATPVVSANSYTPQYGGNIAGTIWKSAGDGEKRRYDFGYDNVNRLLKADFTQLAGGTFDKSAGIDFTVNMGDGVNATSAYDANGNILKMYQKGIKGLNGQADIDGLSYTYFAGSNKLQKVKDAFNDNASTLGDFKYNSEGVNKDDPTYQDYSYDANGNLVSDQNKKITSIQYNYLNLPSLITTDKGTIVYTYDAAGIKLKKVVTENTTSTPKVTTTLYLGAGVYQNDTLQFLGHEEGRLRYQPASGNKGEAFYWDYFLRDHLGNVRMVLTEQRDTVKYLPATVETTTWQTEAKVYDIVDGRRVATPNGADTTHFQQKVYRTLGTNPQEKTGLGAVIKVMCGDQVGLMAESYYQPPVIPVENDKGLAVIDLLTAFTGSDVVKGMKGAIAPGDVNAITGNAANLQSFMQTPSGSLPINAHLAWILFDEQMKYVAGSTDPVSTSTGGYKLHTLSVPVTKNGYLYVYVANQSNQVVYFDNLTLTHYKGPILEETHYYPYGLIMHGISSKAIGSLDNRLEYNGKEKQEKEFSDGVGLETYDFSARMYDPQIGRMWQVDPWVEKYERQSPYVGFNDNPIVFADPTGKGGIASIEEDENGKYIKVRSVIYVYNNKMSKEERQKYANKIQNDILSQWNNPQATDEDGKPISGKADELLGTIGTTGVRVKFDVSVISVDENELDGLMENFDASKNFMKLVDGDGSNTAGGYYGQFDIQQINSRGSTTAAHEYGHMLGYHIDKRNRNLNDQGQNDDNDHAWRSDPNERSYIMSRAKGLEDTGEVSSRRVADREYSRLNNGGGIRLPTNIRQVEIVDPTKPRKYSPFK